MRPAQVPVGKKQGPTDTSDSPPIRPHKEGASSRHTKVPTPSTARPGECLAPTTASPKSPAGNYEDLAREHLGEAPLHTLPPNIPTTTSPMDNIGDSRIQLAHFRLHVPGFLYMHLIPEQYIIHGPGFLNEPQVQ